MHYIQRPDIFCRNAAVRGKNTSLMVKGGSFPGFSSDAICFCKVDLLEDGDELDLGERPLKIIHIPGHTPGSIAVLDVKNRVLISGDPVQQDGHIYMFGPNRNMDQYIKSLEYLESRADEFDEIWPSHADIPVSPEVIPKLREGARAVQAGEIEGKETEMHGFTVKVYDLGFCRLLGEA